MNIIITGRSKIIELVEDATLISEEPTKHDCSLSNYVVERDGIHYLFSAEFSYNNGLMDNRIVLCEAEEVEITTKVWQLKKATKTIEENA